PRQEGQPRSGQTEHSEQKPYEFGQYAENLKTSGIHVSFIGFQGDMDMESATSPIEETMVEIATNLRDQRGHFILNKVHFVESDVHQGEMVLATGTYRLNEIQPGSPGFDTMPEGSVLFDFLPEARHIKNHARSAAQNGVSIVMVVSEHDAELSKTEFESAFAEFDDSRASALVVPLSHLSTSAVIRDHLIGEAIEFVDAKRAPLERRKIYALEDAMAYSRTKVAPAA